MYHNPREKCEQAALSPRLWNPSLAFLPHLSQILTELLCYLVFSAWSSLIIRRRSKDLKPHSTGSKREMAWKLHVLEFLFPLVKEIERCCDYVSGKLGVVSWALMSWIGHQGLAALWRQPASQGDSHLSLGHSLGSVLPRTRGKCVHRGVLLGSRWVIPLSCLSEVWPILNLKLKFRILPLCSLVDWPTHH